MKTRTPALLAVAALAASVAVLSAPLPTHASEAIAISPVLIEKALNPGQVYSDTVKVTNNGTVEITVDKSVADFYYDAAGNIQFVEEKEAAQGVSTLKAWMTIETEPFTIAPRDTKVVPFTITVPQGAEPGGHYGVLFFNTVVDPNSPATVKVAGRVGALVLVEVPGDVRKTAELTGFDVGTTIVQDNKDVFVQKGFFENAPVVFSYGVKNTGNAHFTPEGSIRITNMFGATVADYPAQTEDRAARLRAFPDVNRQITRAWDPGFLLGRYTATISLTDGERTPLPPRTVTFVVFPWKLVLGLLLIAVVVISLLVQLIRRYNKLIVERATKHHAHHKS